MKPPQKECVYSAYQHDIDGVVLFYKSVVLHYIYMVESLMIQNRLGKPASRSNTKYYLKKF